MENKKKLKFGEDEFFRNPKKMECNPSSLNEFDSLPLKYKIKRFFKYLFFNIDY